MDQSISFELIALFLMKTFFQDRFSLYRCNVNETLTSYSSEKVNFKEEIVILCGNGARSNRVAEISIVYTEHLLGEQRRKVASCKAFNILGLKFSFHGVKK